MHAVKMAVEESHWVWQWIWHTSLFYNSAVSEMEQLVSDASYKEYSFFYRLELERMLPFNKKCGYEYWWTSNDEGNPTQPWLELWRMAVRYNMYSCLWNIRLIIREWKLGMAIRS